MPSTHARGARAGPVTAALAVVELVAYGTLYYSFGALLPYLARDLGISTGRASAAFSAALIASAASSALLGPVLDRVGARGPLLAGTVLGAGGLVLWSQVTSATGLLLGWLVLGAVGPLVFYEPAFHVVVRTQPAARRTRSVLLITLVGGFASTVFVPVLGATAQQHGWRTAALVAAGALLAVNLPLAVMLWRTIPPHARARPDAPAVRRGRGGVPGLLRDRNLLLVAAAMSAPGLLTGALAAHLVVMLLAFGHGGAFAYATAGLLGAGSVTGRLTVAGLGRWHSLPRILIAGFALQGAALLLLAAAGQHRVPAVVATVVIGTGFGLTSLARPLLTAAYVGPQRFGASSGAVSALSGLTRAAGPVVVGAVAASSAGYRGALVLLVVPLTLSVAALARLPAMHQDAHLV